MAPARFRQTDFMEWDNSIDKSVEKVLANQLTGMAEKLLECLPGYRIEPQVSSRDYIGHNFWDPNLNKDDPQPIPHWSLGLVRAERRLRLFITAESKPLINWLLKQRPQLDADLAESISTINNKIKDSLILRVDKKWFLVPGGKGKNASLYMPVWSAPLSLLTDKDKIDLASHSALDVAECLQQEKIEVQFLATMKKRTVIGVIQLDFSFNWFELEELGTDVWKKLHPMVEIMMPFYNVLLEHMPGKKSNCNPSYQTKTKLGPKKKYLSSLAPAKSSHLSHLSPPDTK